MESTYDDYPAWIVIVTNLLAVTIYALGAYILAGLGVWAVGAYLLLCLLLEAKVLTQSCANCVYYGWTCGTGKGQLCALLLKRGDPQVLAQGTASWKDVAPDMAVSLLPVVAGVVLLIRSFNWALLVAMLALLALSMGGNAIMRGRFLCRYCRQREIGCPAARLFEQRS